MPQEEAYLLEIDLPSNLTTTYNKNITFRQEMRGASNIITDARRILGWIFDRVNNILKNV